MTDGTFGALGKIQTGLDLRSVSKTISKFILIKKTMQLDCFEAFILLTSLNA